MQKSPRDDSVLVLSLKEHGGLVARAPAASGAKRPWSDSKRALHRLACKDKEKLSLGQKLELVQRATEVSDAREFRTQAQLASMFGKSRSEISKILRPENVKKLKQVAATGMHPDVKRHSWRDSSSEFLELEHRVHQYVLTAPRDEHGNPCSGQVCKRAEELADEIGVPNFKGTYGWFTRFLRRHRLSADLKNQGTHATSAYFNSHVSLASSACGTHSDSPKGAIDISSGGSVESRALTQGTALCRSRSDDLREAWPEFEHVKAEDNWDTRKPDPVCHEAPAQEIFHEYVAAQQQRVEPDALDGVIENWHCYSHVCGKVMVNVKAMMHTPFGPTNNKVLRRMRMAIPVDFYGCPMNGFGMMNCIISSAFHSDLENAAICGVQGILRLSYFDRDGDAIAIDNDHELGMALQHQRSVTGPLCEPTLRLQLCIDPRSSTCNPQPWNN